MRIFFMMGVALAATVSVGAVAQQQMAQELARPIETVWPAAAVEIPLERRNGKLYFDATVDGKAGAFLFDTGSPTVLSRDFAQSLNLTIIGRNTGVDSHGAVITMELAIVEELRLGDLVFRNVPVLLHDYPKTGMGKCLIGDGLIGSEIFPGGAWRIDTQDSRLTIAADVASLPPPAEGSLRADLHDFGYPHAPIFDYGVGGLADKALFDTGNGASISWFAKAVEHPDVGKAIAPGSHATGQGYEGESAGGLSARGEIVRFTVDGVSVASGGFPAIPSIVRAGPPTLFGAGLLRQYVVTLDYPGGEVIFEPRTQPEGLRPVPDYNIAMIGGEARIARLFTKSGAESAGLRPDDAVVAINGRRLSRDGDPSYCEDVNWLVDKFDANQAALITVLRDGREVVLEIPARD